ncbi:MAG: vWA domain-containing protein [Succiniclasticum sp.]|jgi:uncharacterized protein YegL|nr:vWA domain-containing protein [Succiniclasticum sp.]MEE3479482.1 vWA domain-containing protein [Succiniclasticum sp.]
MKQNLTELVFILDKSGSMTGLEKDTIGGFNSMLEKQKKVDGECRVTTVLFDNRYELLHDRIDLQAVQPLTEKDYETGGSTALLDAIGRTIHKIGTAQRHTADAYRAAHVLFVIITDGEENSSREYTSRKVKEMIERQKSKYGWEFVFLGANIDAVATAEEFGIGQECAADYVADGEGTELNFRVMSDAVMKFRAEGCFSGASLDRIRKDRKKRGGRH